MKKNKGSGKSIISGARKTAEIAWALLTAKTKFDSCGGINTPTLASGVLFQQRCQELINQCIFLNKLCLLLFNLI